MTARVKSTLSLVLSLALFGLLALSWTEGRRIEGELESLRERILLEKRGRSTGFPFPEGPFRALDGTTISFRGAEGGSVVLFFSPDCPACDETASEWDWEAEQAAERGTQFVGISRSREGLEEFLLKHSLRFPVILDEHGALAKALGITFVPNRVSLDDQGFIELRNSEILALRRKRSSFQAAVSRWPESARERFYLALGSYFGKETKKVELLPLGARSEPVLVFQNQSEIIGFGKFLFLPVDFLCCSDVEVFLGVEANGEKSWVVLLRETWEAEERNLESGLERGLGTELSVSPENGFLRTLLSKKTEEFYKELGFPRPGQAAVDCSFTK